ncbi:MAG: pgk, phosphoglycerate kinase, phosphoglycerate kinase [Candidatus Parcubacteria bacterium]|nr:pgk, phosphoglycerate kinase, phosphoglycerate kinase [Candidatus Parcubacteria bacterium]
MKSIRDIEHLEGVRILVRVDFNVPIKNGAIADDIRIRSALPTINFLREKGAKLILISHLEVIEGERATLEPVARKLGELGIPVAFVKDYAKVVQMLEHEVGNGSVILLENLRTYEGEKENDPKFAKELASLADVYVNDAFSVSHREHASIVGVPKLLPGYAGFQLEKEVTNIAKAFDPDHPFLFILGGSKFATKLPLLLKFMEKADAVFVGGALANDFFKAKGYEVGTSLLSEGSFDFNVFLNNPKLLLPIDVVTEKHETKPADGVAAGDKILDVGPKTIEMLREKISSMKFILWNGPLGMYEDGYTGPTLELARMIGDATSADTATIVGGGDTLAAIAALGIEDKFTFVSTAGGAMLDFLSKGTLPGIEALEKSE